MPKLSTSEGATTNPTRVRRRLSAEDRREDMLFKAIEYFATHGFMGNTRDLARHIGVAQPLLYRYFPSKSDLIDAVFEEMYARQRRHEWEVRLSDRTRCVTDRVTEFFTLYAERTYTYDWIRLYTFAGLMDGELNRRYIRRITEPTLRRICVEAAVALGHPERNPDDVTRDELDVLWLLHGGLFYFAIRKYVYGEDPNRSLSIPIERGVRQTLDTLAAIYTSALPEAAPAKRSRSRRVAAAGGAR